LRLTRSILGSKKRLKNINIITRSTQGSRKVHKSYFNFHAGFTQDSLKIHAQHANRTSRKTILLQYSFKIHTRFTQDSRKTSRNKFQYSRKIHARFTSRFIPRFTSRFTARFSSRFWGHFGVTFRAKFKTDLKQTRSLSRGHLSYCRFKF
jgi:hypothetical protein